MEATTNKPNHSFMFYFVIVVALCLVSFFIYIYYQNVQKTEKFDPRFVSEQEKDELLLRSMHAHAESLGYSSKRTLKDRILGFGDTRYLKYEEYFSRHSFKRVDTGLDKTPLEAAMEWTPELFSPNNQKGKPSSR